MGLGEYSWSQEDIDAGKYVGKYVTHDWINKKNIVQQVENPDTDLELGEHTLEYDGEKMDVELVANNRWAALLYDETFDEKLGDQRLEEVITYFLTPEPWKPSSNIHPE
ncbi:hypothetical protein AQV86_03975 [Nanohaloarchaea archaeon SG9]|nr:hypothetical protein AQV86_03975 [Nanohaloarchaea archaeon SG9]